MASTNTTWRFMSPSSLTFSELNERLKFNDPSIIFALSFIVVISYIFVFGIPILLNVKRSWKGGHGFKKLRNMPWKDGVPFLSYKEFYYDNDGFLKKGFKELGDTFAFRFMSHKVIAITGGEEARKIFHQHKDLSFSKGWDALRGEGVSIRRAKKVELMPELPDWPVKADMAPYVKRAATLFRKERLNKCIPLMFEDLMPYVDNWGKKGRFNPWDEFFTALMHLLLHSSSFREITSNPTIVKRIADLYKELEETRSFGGAFYPRLAYVSSYVPFLKYVTGGIVESGDGERLRRRIGITKELLGIMKPVMDGRCERRDGSADEEMEKVNVKERVDDQMQVLIDEGDHPMSLIQFMMTTLFAGMLNTFKTTCWTIVYVLSNPKYRALIREEVELLVRTSSSSSLPSSGNIDPILSRLSQIPFEEWDTQMPILDLCIRETIRLLLSGVALRKNVGDKSVIIPGANAGEDIEVKPGECIVASGKVLHMDENIYPDPMKWDPSRYERGEDKKYQIAYMGWGAGRHVCPGKRLAELETKMVVASLIMKYPDCYLELEEGTRVDTMEKVPARSQGSKVLVPPVESIYIRCN